MTDEPGWGPPPGTRPGTAPWCGHYDAAGDPNHDCSKWDDEDEDEDA